jgi:hypothetical protein
MASEVSFEHSPFGRAQGKGLPFGTEKVGKFLDAIGGANNLMIFCRLAIFGLRKIYCRFFEVDLDILGNIGIIVLISMMMKSKNPYFRCIYSWQRRKIGHGSKGRRSTFTN